MFPSGPWVGGLVLSKALLEGGKTFQEIELKEKSLGLCEHAFKGSNAIGLKATGPTNHQLGPPK